MTKVDLHVHCQERSRCGRSSEEDQIQTAIESGLDAIVFTDHVRLVPSAHLDSLNRRYAPFRIFGGTELCVEGEDYLILGIQDKRLLTRDWTYRQLHAFAEKRNGLLVLAHPFRYRDFVHSELDRFPPDAVELSSTNTPVHAEPVIREFARRVEIPLVSNSDSHATWTLGKHFNVLHAPAHSESELIAMIRSGAFHFHTP